MDTPHLSKGSSIPPKKDGTLRLYSMKFCPYAERARIVLQVKKQPHDIVNVNLQIKPDWLFDLNPRGQVPILDVGGEILTESLVICDYLDRTYPDPPLYPENDVEKKRDVDLINKYDSLIRLYYSMVRKTDDKPLSEFVADLSPLLEEFEAELERRGNYFGGIKPSMVDYMIWPWAERVGVINLVHGEDLPIPETSITNIRKWCERMRNLDEIKETITDTTTLYQASQFHKPGVVANYDSI